MSRLKVYAALIVVCTAAVAGWWLMSYGPQAGEGFGIYLLDSDELILSDGDIITYDGGSHEITLSEGGIGKIEELSSRVPLNGTRFVLRIKGEDIYEGWFWSPISSLPCSGIVIETLVRNNTIKIEAGYPSSHFQGEDPRNNPRVFDYFMSVGKLAD